MRITLPAGAPKAILGCSPSFLVTQSGSRLFHDPQEKPDVYLMERGFPEEGARALAIVDLADETACLLF